MPCSTSLLTSPRLPDHLLFLSLRMFVSGDLISYSVGFARAGRCPPTCAQTQAHTLTHIHVSEHSHACESLSPPLFGDFRTLRIDITPG